MKAILLREQPGLGADGTVLAYTVTARTLGALGQWNSLLEIGPRASGGGGVYVDTSTCTCAGHTGSPGAGRRVTPRPPPACWPHPRRAAGGAAHWTMLAQSLCWGSCLTVGPGRWQPHSPGILGTVEGGGTGQAGRTSFISSLCPLLLAPHECQCSGHGVTTTHMRGDTNVCFSSNVPSFGQLSLDQVRFPITYLHTLCSS